MSLGLNSGKNLLRFFGLLDIISVLQMSPQVYALCMNYNHLPDQLSSKIRIVLLLLNYLLLFASAAGLLTIKKYGIITYYIEFPLRLLVWVFSFGFITFINEYVSNPGVLHWLLRIVVMLEFFRLYFTIQIHRKYFR